MKFGQICAAIAAISCIGLGLKLRKQQNKNAKAMLFAGIALLAFVAVSLVFGLEM